MNANGQYGRKRKKWVRALSVMDLQVLMESMVKSLSVVHNSPKYSCALLKQKRNTIQEFQNVFIYKETSHLRSLRIC